MNKVFNVALIGNPNCGKTTIFNSITGFRQKIGNYPGVTVEKKQGIIKVKDLQINFVDLPGIYSLNANSDDEKVAKEFIIDNKIDAIINIIDASNLEKSLYLTTQLIELGYPIVLVLNMMDIVKKKNIFLDEQFLSSILEVETIFYSTTEKKNVDVIVNKALEIAKMKKSLGINIKFDPTIEIAIKKVQSKLLEDIPQKGKRLLSLRLLENDSDFVKKVDEDIYNLAIDEKKLLEKEFSDDIEFILSKQRHKFIKQICSKYFIKKDSITISDKIDRYATHKYWGIVIFLAIMSLIFTLTFVIGSFPSSILQNFVTIVSQTLSNIWPQAHLPLLKSLVIDGVVSGVGAVISFLPNIMILFFSIAILEDTGYMSRAAFVLDRVMHRLGLHGKSFIPMLIGFGCSVPAILATRFLESKNDRLITIQALPLIACSAKLVVFTLIIPAFFSRFYQPIILLSLYLIGIVLAISVIKIFKLAMFKKESFSFAMELSDYKVPSFFSLLLHMWDKSKEYLKKAATLILGFSIILWFLSAFPLDRKEDQKSYMAQVGTFLNPIFKPLGFDWKINTSLISAFAAKEVFVAQLGVIYSVKNPNDMKMLQDKLRSDYTPIQAYSILLFILISSPCIATIAVTKKELKSYFWGFFQVTYLTLLAYFASMIFYQIATLF